MLLPRVSDRTTLPRLEIHPIMKPIAARILAPLLALVALLVLAGATSKSSQLLQPDKLVILSTTDVEGKTSPCG